MKRLTGINLTERQAQAIERVDGRYSLGVVTEEDVIKIEASNLRDGIFLEMDFTDASWLGYELIRLTYDKMEHAQKLIEES